MSMNRCILAAVGLICIVCCLPGCATDPTGGVDEPKTGSEVWPGLFEKEDLVETIRLCYQRYDDADIDDLEFFYQNILYDDPAGENDYVWMMQAADVAKGHPEILTREQDIRATINIFKNAHSLDFDISGGDWIACPDVCEGCYRTTREYSISIVAVRNGRERIMGSTGMRVLFVAGPHHDDPEKWAIYSATDLPAVN